MSSSYEWKQIGNYDVLVLSFYEAQQNLVLTVLPNYGANILKFSYNGKTIIDYDLEKLENGDFTGTPVLFPTPNRVKDSKIVFCGKTYPQTKKGKERSCHGLVFDEPFVVEEISCEEDFAQVRLSISVNKESDIYTSFPFECKLNLVYQINRKGLKIQYIFENFSTVSVPYGFGLHPYFTVTGRERLILPSVLYLDAVTCFPTGNVINTDEIKPNMATNGVIVGECVLDTDFVRDSDNDIYMIYPNENIKLTIKSTQQFKHIVVYKPENGNFICIEPQTCSIDAHHMATTGFEYSNLLWLEKGQTDCGTVEILIES